MDDEVMKKKCQSAENNGAKKQGDELCQMRQAMNYVQAMAIMDKCKQADGIVNGIGPKGTILGKLPSLNHSKVQNFTRMRDKNEQVKNQSMDNGSQSTKRPQAAL